MVFLLYLLPIFNQIRYLFQIVALTNSPLGNIHPNLTEINVLPAYDFWSDGKLKYHQIDAKI